ncbi:hypothetical protein Bca52824_033389 [Brassica carinata]|uniref:Uncharacterized protein n=1 Tax=Brassica carinata TaxID=52824 RepID=A0A8X7SED9_BRACI|nr:hypothetical protein Bca52824_033389 [Brassica carinata]
MHDEIREGQKKMAQYWEDQAASWSKKMKTWKMETAKTDDEKAIGDVIMQDFSDFTTETTTSTTFSDETQASHFSVWETNNALSV